MVSLFIDSIIFSLIDQKFLNTNISFISQLVFLIHGSNGRLINNPPSTKQPSSFKIGLNKNGKAIVIESAVINVKSGCVLYDISTMLIGIAFKFTENICNSILL